MCIIENKVKNYFVCFVQMNFFYYINFRLVK